MRAGCVPVMINTKLPADQVRYIAKDADVKMVFCEEKLRTLCDAQTRCVSFEEHGEAGYREFVDPGPFLSFSPNSKDIAEQPYTSGSTGRPKGVLLHHVGQRWMIRRLIESRDITAGDCGIIAAPLYHKNALLAIKSALGAGGRVVLLAKFDVREYIRCIGEYGLTMLTGVPTMYALLLQQEEFLKQTDLSSVRALSMGSAPASEVLLDNLQLVFPRARINLNYGITEGGPVLLSWKHADGLEKPRATVGYPLPDVEIRLVDGPHENEGILGGILQRRTNAHVDGLQIYIHGNSRETKFGRCRYRILANDHVLETELQDKHPAAYKRTI